MGESSGNRPQRPRAEGPEKRQNSLKPLSKDYFDIQLRFAETASEKSGIALEHVVFTHTNFYARLSFGTRRELDEHNPAWQEFIRNLVNQSDKTSHAHDVYLKAPPEKSRPELRFGCFSCDLADGGGAVHLHFMNNDSDGIRPLSVQRIAIRKKELTDMFGEIRRRHPRAKTVRGRSWLYHTEEYRRLFPPSYGDSRAISRYSESFQGTSRWGQFLDRNGNVVGDIKDHFLENLKNVDLEHITDAFPLPTYRAEAPVQDFYDFYGITGEPDNAACL